MHSFSLVRLARDDRGVAAVEFALLAPLLILFFFGVIEVSNLLIADTKMRSVAANVADLITQDSDGSVNNANLQEAAIAAQRIMSPLSTTMLDPNANLGVLVTNYKTDSIGTTTVRWSRLLPNQGQSGSIGGIVNLSTKPCTDNGSLPTGLATVSNDVVKVEVVYLWRPWFTSIFRVSPFRLHAVNYNMPRYVSQLLNGSDVNPGCA